MKKTALITGATAGIGYELAKIFARNGYNLLITARSENALQSEKSELEKEYDITVDYFVKDLSLANAPEELYAFVKEKNIIVDVLVNNAGIGNSGAFSETELHRELTMINLNISAVTKLTKYFLKEMVARKSGKVLNVASTAAFQPGPLMAVYYATKAYVLSFTEAISNEIAGSGVTITALCPGPTKTLFQDAAELNSVRLFKLLKVAEAKDVAEYGYQQMLKGKVIAIPGLMNKIGAESVRFSPRFMVRNIVRKLQEEA